MLPGDPANEHLTEGDRAAIKTATGADFRANGSILYPVSISLGDAAAVSTVAGQVAFDRASGKLAGGVTPDYLTRLLQQQGYQGTGLAPSSGIDALA